MARGLAFAPTATYKVHMVGSQAGFWDGASRGMVAGHAAASQLSAALTASVGLEGLPLA